MKFGSLFLVLGNFHPILVSKPAQPTGVKNRETAAYIRNVGTYAMVSDSERPSGVTVSCWLGTLPNVTERIFGMDEGEDSNERCAGA